jgi:hypothetical protein
VPMRLYKLVYLLAAVALVACARSSGPTVASPTVLHTTTKPEPVTIATEAERTVTGSVWPPTATPIPPSATAPMQTRTDLPPAAVTSGLIQPYPSAPLCSGDDLGSWHGLWNYQLGCHYSYEQGDDPHLGDAIFGPPAAAWGGQTIGWPWVSSAIENMPAPLGKHNGYKWAINQPGYNPWPACVPLTLANDVDTAGTQTNCITASRIEAHILGSLQDSLARYHSSYVEYKICSWRSGFTECGILRMGAGLTDFAQLNAPHYSTRIIRPGGVVDFGGGIVLTYTADGPDLPNTSGEPYIFDYPASDLGFFQAHPPTYSGGFNTFPGTMAQWSSNDYDCEPKPAGDPCHQSFFHFLYQVANTWTLIDTANPNHPVFICRDGSCGYNGSAHGVEEVGAMLLRSWQPIGAGFVTFHGYSDRYGNPVLDGSCTAPAFACIPFDLEHVPVGIASNRHDQGCECSHELGYDIFFDGRQSGWVTFPN